MKLENLACPAEFVTAKAFGFSLVIFTSSSALPLSLSCTVTVCPFATEHIDVIKNINKYFFIVYPLVPLYKLIEIISVFIFLCKTMIAEEAYRGLCSVKNNSKAKLGRLLLKPAVLNYNYLRNYYYKTKRKNS